MRLPVVCGECRWCHHTGACMHDRAHAVAEIDGINKRPPAWCPLPAERLAALERVAEAARGLCSGLTTDRLPSGGTQWREALELRDALAELDKTGGGA